MSTLSSERNHRPFKSYNESFKRKVVKEYEEGNLNKDAIQKKYGIGGNSRVLTWCRKYGKLYYEDNTEPQGRPMKDPQKQRIKALEHQLHDAQLKLIAYEKLIRIAEKEEGICILKKDVAKQFMNLHKPIQEK